MIYSHSECAEYFVKRNNLEISAIEKLIFLRNGPGNQSEKFMEVNFLITEMTLEVIKALR
ncbi:MAG: hypothetical protein P8N92_07340 [Burkholderiales bacterium]|nr:hypothetical protein [Burkholderiales bacterium]